MPNIFWDTLTHKCTFLARMGWVEVKRKSSFLYFIFEPQPTLFSAIDAKKLRICCSIN